jgi:hypothetical protein
MSEKILSYHLPLTAKIAYCGAPKTVFGERAHYVPCKECARISEKLADERAEQLLREYSARHD